MLPMKIGRCERKCCLCGANLKTLFLSYLTYSRWKFNMKIVYAWFFFYIILFCTYFCCFTQICCTAADPRAFIFYYYCFAFYFILRYVFGVLYSLPFSRATRLARRIAFTKQIFVFKARARITIVLFTRGKTKVRKHFSPHVCIIILHTCL